MKKQSTCIFDKHDNELLNEARISPCKKCRQYPCEWTYESYESKIRYYDWQKECKDLNIWELAEQLAELRSLKSEIDELEIKIAHTKNDYEKKKTNYKKRTCRREWKLCGSE